ncbi:hypothetical protein [Solimicrobium silvestre]|nr:hypothetical protein [Solimicrobium silvestre]
MLEIQHVGDGTAVATEWIAAQNGYTQGPSTVLGKWVAGTLYQFGQTSAGTGNALIEIQNVNGQTVATRWTVGATGLTQEDQTTLGRWSANNSFQYGDVTGTGELDLMEVAPTGTESVAVTRWIAGAVGTGFTQGASLSLTDPEGGNGGFISPIALQDVGGTGYLSLVIPWTYSTAYYSYDQVSVSSTGTLTSVSNGLTGLKYVGANISTVYAQFSLNNDPNTSGKGMGIVYENTSGTVSFESVIPSTGAMISVSLGTPQLNQQFLAGDVTGNGRSDLVQIWENAQGQAIASVWYSNAQGNAYTQGANTILGAWQAGATYQLASANGKISAAIVMISTDATGNGDVTLNTWYSTGTGFGNVVISGVTMQSTNYLSQSSVGTLVDQNFQANLQSVNAVNIAGSVVAGTSTSYVSELLTATLVDQSFQASIQAINSASNTVGVVAGTSTSYSSAPSTGSLVDQNYQASSQAINSASNTASVVAGNSTGYSNQVTVRTPVDQTFQASIQTISPATNPEINAAANASILQTQQTLPVPTGVSLNATYDVFNANGQVAYNIASNGLVTQNTYDANGNLVTQIQYATTVNVSSAPTYAAMQQMVAGIANAALDRRTDYVYNANNEAIYKVDPNGGVTYVKYDAAGQVIQTTEYSQALSTSVVRNAPLTATQVAAGITPDVATDLTEYSVYNSQGRLQYQIDGMGHVTETDYDAVGNVIATRTYQQPISLPLTQPLTVTGVSQLLQASPADQVSYALYDADNRPIYQISGTGYVTQTVYNQASQSTEQIVYGKAITLSGAPTLQSVQTQLPAQPTSGVDSVTQYSYNADGEVTFKVDGAGHVTHYAYNGDGQVIQTIHYAAIYTAATGLAAYGTPGSADQVIATVYNVVGQVADQIDPEGVVTQYVYDSLGRVVETVQHAIPVAATAGTLDTYAQLQAQYAVTTPADHISYAFYDAQGNKAYDVDADGNVTAYQHNAFGQLTGSISYTTPVTGTPTLVSLQSQYSAAGVADRSSTAVYDNDGNVLYSISSLGDVIAQTYNGLGEVVTNIAYANAISLPTGAITPATITALLQPSSADQTTSYVYDADGHRIQTTDALGNKEYATYNAEGQVASTTDADGNVTTQQYNVAGQLISVTDAASDATHITYNALGLKASVTDADGNTTTYGYDRAGELTSTTDGLGNTTIYGYNSFGNQITVTNALGNTTTTTYDLDGRATAIKDAMGNTRTQSYNIFGDVTTQADALGNTTQNYYDADDQLTLSIAPNGAATSYQYNAFGNVIAETHYATLVTNIQAGVMPNVVTSNTDQTSYNVYNANGQVAFRIAPSGLVTQNIYDTNGNLVTQIQYATSVNVSSTPTYAAMQQLVAGIANPALNRRTDYVYNADNEVEYKVDPNGGVTYLKYDANGQVVQTTQYSSSLSASVARDAPLTAAQVAAGITPEAATDQTQYSVYNSQGLVQYQIDGLGYVTEANYDAVGNVIATRTYQQALSLPLAQPLTVAGISQLLQASSNDQVSYTLYDADNHPLYQISGTGYVTQTVYNQAGEVTEQIVYGKAIVLTGTPTLASVQTQLPAQPTSGIDSVTQYAYNADGQVTSETNGAGHVTQYTYNADGQVTQTKVGTEVTSTTYNTVGQVISQTDPTGLVTHYVYDGLGRVIETIQQAATTSAERISYTFYNTQGNKAYDVDPDGDVTGYQYNAFGQLTSSISYATPVTGTPTLASLQSQYGAAGVNDRSSTAVYDNDGNVLYSIDSLGEVTGYRYNALGEVVVSTAYANAISLPTGAVMSATPATIAALLQPSITADQTTHYFYDADGNRVQTTEALTVNKEYANYNAEGQVTSTTDTDGNVMTKQYNAAGQLIAVTDGADTAHITYNALGLKSSTTDADGNTTTYGYDGAGELTSVTDALGYTTTYTYDGNGNKTAETSGQYLVAPGSANYHAALAASAVPITTKWTYDLDGRLLTTTDAAGDTQTTTYDAFGDVTNIASGTSAVSTPLVTNFYDSDGRKTMSIDGTGAITGYQYDAFGDVVTQTAYATRLPAAVGNTATAPTPITSSADEVTTTTYDTLGRATSMVNAMGYTSTNVYDRWGNLITNTIGQYLVSPQSAHYNAALASFAAPQTTAYVYDADNNLVYEIDPQRAVTYTQRNGDGNPVSVTQYAKPLSANIDITTPLTLAQVQAGIAAMPTAILNGTQVTQEADEVTSIEYDAQGHISSKTNGNGYTTSYTYNGEGQQLTETTGQYLVAPGAPNYNTALANAAAPSTTTNVYDADGHLTQVTNGAGLVVAYSYDNNGNKVSMTVAPSTNLAQTTTYTYDSEGRLIGTYAPDGGITLLTYSTTFPTQIATQRTLQSDVGGNQVWLNESYQYDSAGRISSETQQSGLILHYAYDAFGNQLSSTTVGNPLLVSVNNILNYGPAGLNNTANIVTSATYNVLNQRVTSTDANNNTTRYNYDSVGNEIQQIDPLHNVTHFYYDGAGNKIGEVDPLGYYTAWTYDLFGNQVTQTQYANAVTGNLSGMTPPSVIASTLDRVQSGGYDANNQLIVSTTADGSVTTYARDGRGNVLVQTQYGATINSATGASAATPSTPRITTSTYDDANNTLTSVDWTGKQTSSSYNADGNLAQQTVSYAGFPDETLVTTYSYDLCNRQTSVSQNLSGLYIVNSVTYDLVGNITGKINADGGVYTYTYDSYNRPIYETNEVGQIVDAYVYDAFNRIINTGCSNGLVQYTFDANGNKLSKTLDSSWQSIETSSSINTNINTNVNTSLYQYDANDNLIQTTNANGSKVTNYYDADNQLIETIDADGVVHTYQYDAFGDQTQSTLYMTLSSTPTDLSTPPAPPVGATQVITTTYDQDGRVTTVTYPEILVTTVNIEALMQSNPTTTSMVAPVAQTIYDAWGNVVESVNAKGQTTFNYYNAQGQISVSVNAAGYLTTYQYNGAGEVTQQTLYYQNALDVSGDASSVNVAQIPVGTGLTAVTSYTYDVVGRLVTETGPARTVTNPDGTQSPASPVTLTQYDADGNVIATTTGYGTAQATTVFNFYDVANRLIGTVNANRMLTLNTYDAADNKTSVISFANAVPATVNLDVAEWLHTSATQLYNLVAPSANDQVTVYVYGYQNQLLAQQTSLFVGNPNGTANYGSPNVGTGQTLIGGVVHNTVDGSIAELVNQYGITYGDLIGTEAVQVYGYDNFGNRTYVKDANGNVTTSQYDNDGHLTLAYSAVGTSVESETIAQYDAAGNQISVYMGSMTNQTVIPTNITASQGASININWTVSGMNTGTTWVVWSTAPQTNISGYANTAGSQSTSNGNCVASITTPDSGTNLYFRVVTQDANGNEQWSAEQELTVVPQNDTISAQASTGGGLLVTAHFTGSITNPTLNWGTQGTSGTLPNTVTLTSIGNGLYQGILPANANVSGLVYNTSWSANGTNYSGAIQQLAATYPQVGVVSNVQTQWLNGQNNNGYNIVLNTTVTTSSPIGNNNTATLSGISALVQTANNPRVTEVDAVATTINGVETYSILLGDENVPLAAGTYTITLFGTPTDGNAAYAISSFNYTVSAQNSSAPSAATTFNQVAWLNPNNSTNNAYVVVDGQIQASVASVDQLTPGTSIQVGGSTIYNAAAIAAGNNTASIAYAQPTGTTNSGNIASTPATQQETVNVPTGNDNVVITIASTSIPTNVVINTGSTTVSNDVEITGTGGTPSDGDNLPPPSNGNTGSTSGSGFGTGILFYYQLAGATGAATMIPMELINGQLTVNLSGLAPGNYSYSVTGKDAQGNLIIISNGTYTPTSSVGATQQGVLNFATTVQTTPTVETVPVANTYNLNLNFAFSTSEMATMVGGLQVQLTRYSNGSVMNVPMSIGTDGVSYNGTQQVVTDSSGIANQYEVKVWYINTQGQTVIVNWFHYNPTQNWSVSGSQSSAILEQELADTLINDGNTFYNGAGVYEGAQAVNDQTFQLALVQTYNQGGGSAGNGATGYYINSQYDAMGYLVAGNTADGMWHTYGVNVAGLAVASAEWGVAATPLLSGLDAVNFTWNQTPSEISLAWLSAMGLLTDTYTFYDTAGRTIGSAGIQFTAVASDTDSTTHQQRDVTLYQYNAYNEVTAQATTVGSDLNLNVFDMGTALGGTFASAIGTHEFSVYDAAGQKVETINAGYEATTASDAIKVQYQYDILGQLVTTINANNYATQMKYDAGGNLVQQIQTIQQTSAGVATQIAVTTYLYDTFGRQIVKIDGDGNVTQTTYDQRNLILSQGVVGVLSSSWYLANLTGDEIANLPVVPSQLAATLAAYIPLDQQVQIPVIFTPASDLITVNTYDDNGNLASKTAGTDVVSYTYDAFNRIVTTTTHQYGTTAQTGTAVVATQSFDVYGNLTQTNDGAGDITTYTYGAFNQLLSKTVGTPTKGEWVPFSYSSNRNGEISENEEEDSDGLYKVIPGNQVTTNYAYNDLNELTQETNTAGDSTHTADENITQTWDFAGHLLSTNDAANGVTTYSYDSYGNQVNTDFSSNISSNFYPVSATSYQEPVLRDMAYTYDAFGRQTSWTDVGTGLSTSYQYDNAGNVIDVSSGTGGGTGDENSDLINPNNPTEGVGAVTGEVGDAASVEGADLTGVAFNHSYTFNGNNQVMQMSATGNQLIELYGYDNDGNLTQEDNQAVGTDTLITYDSMGRETDSMMIGGSVDQEYANYGYTQQYQVGMTDTLDGMQSFTVGGIDGSFNDDSTLGKIAQNLYGSASLWTYIQAANPSLANIANLGPDTVLPVGMKLHAYNLWQTQINYDGNGNVIQQTSGFGDAIGTRTNNQYYGDNTLYATTTESTTWTSDMYANSALGILQLASHVDTSLAITSATTYSVDGSGRILAVQTNSYGNFSGGDEYEQLASAGQTDSSSYTYHYNGFGQVLSIDASGANDSAGTSTMVYNADEQEISLVQGQGDGMQSAETSNYLYNTAGQIIYQKHQDGQAGDYLETISYDVNSSGNQVGETGVYADGQRHTYLDGGSYAEVQQVMPSQVGSGQSGYTATGGENLAQVAQTVYGNSALWYLIANANGLTENTSLKAGEQISVPSGMPTGQANSTTGKPYNAGEIQGGNLPNLKTPPPADGGGCSTFGLILLVVVAIIVTIATEGATAEYLGTVAADGGAAVGGAAATGGTVAAGDAAVVAGGTAAAGGTAVVGGTAIVGGTAAVGDAAVVTGIDAVTGGGISGAFTTGISVLTGGSTIVGGTAVAVGVAAGSAFVGSVVSQEIGVASNSNMHFSLKQAGLAALSAGTTAGLGVPSSPMSAVGDAVVVDAVTQEAAIRLNLQQRFSWAQLAASGIVAGVMKGESGSVNQALDKAASIAGSTANMVNGIVDGVASAVAQHALTNALANNAQDRESWNSAGVFGAALSGAIYSAGQPVPGNTSLPVDPTTGLQSFSYASQQANTVGYLMSSGNTSTDMPPIETPVISGPSDADINQLLNTLPAVNLTPANTGTSDSLGYNQSAGLSYSKYGGTSSLDGMQFAANTVGVPQTATDAGGGSTSSDMLKLGLTANENAELNSIAIKETGTLSAYEGFVNNYLNNNPNASVQDAASAFDAATAANENTRLLARYPAPVANGDGSEQATSPDLNLSLLTVTPPVSNPRPEDLNLTLATPVAPNVPTGQPPYIQPYMPMAANSSNTQATPVAAIYPTITTSFPFPHAPNTPSAQAANGLVSMLASKAVTAAVGGTDKVTAADKAAWTAANPNASIFGGVPTIQYQMDVSAGTMTRVVGTSQSLGDQIKDTLSLGLIPTGKALGNFAGGISAANNSSLPQSIRNQGAYDAGANSLSVPTAAMMVAGSFVGSASRVGATTIESVEASSRASVGIADSVSGLQLRESLARQAGTPRGLDNVWGSSLDDLKTTYTMDGYSVTDKAARANSSGNAQIFTVENNPLIKEVQYSPSTEQLPLADQSQHIGEYYKFTYQDGSKAKVIDPNTYQMGSLEKNVQYFNQQGQSILYNPVTRTWGIK